MKPGSARLNKPEPLQHFMLVPDCNNPNEEFVDHYPIEHVLRWWGCLTALENSIHFPRVASGLYWANGGGAAPPP